MKCTGTDTEFGRQICSLLFCYVSVLVVLRQNDMIERRKRKKRFMESESESESESEVVFFKEIEERRKKRRQAIYVNKQ